MNRQKFKELLYEISSKRIELTLKKSSDYADEDVLSNFKRMSLICGVFGINPARSSADCALFLLLLKVDRWCNIRRKGSTPANEAIMDTLLDAHNYIDLAYACQLDEEVK